MRYLFLILTLLGLATFGDVNRTPSADMQAAAPQPAVSLVTEEAAAEGFVVAFQDGNPIPKAR
jgi:hypothetical protein